MRALAIAGLCSLALTVTMPVAAQDRPVTDQRPNARDVVTMPLTDLNLRKGEIPPLLQRAVELPYNLDGLSTCSALIAEVERFDIMLGDDFDLPEIEAGGMSAGSVGKMAVSSLIPFRGLIREVSGARKEQQKLETAIRAGLTRRGFLKGVGTERGCAYPARPAREEDIARIVAQREAAEIAAED